MAFAKDHDLHKRRLGMNVGVALTLVAFVAVMFGVTVVKVTNGGLIEAYDHQPRASVLPITEPVQ